jgi:hypothetical protein
MSSGRTEQATPSMKTSMTTPPFHLEHAWASKRRAQACRQLGSRVEGRAVFRVDERHKVVYAQAVTWIRA